MSGETPSKDREPALEAVIGPFARLTDRLQLAPREIRDEADLPFPKQEIAEAILQARVSDRPHSYSPAQLEGWLAELAQFQPGVGAPICDPPAEIARRMTAARTRKEKIDTLRLQRTVEDESEEQGWNARRLQFRAQVDRDRARLLGMLKSTNQRF